MNIGSLGCKPSSKKQVRELIECLNDKVTSYTFNNKEFSNLLEIYTYAKKHKINKGNIINRVGIWGDVSKLTAMTKKTINEYYM